MSHDYDTVVVGCGLAGACSAYYVSATRSVLLLEAGEPASGASGVAPGMANPISGRRARPVWRAEAAYDALHSTLAAVDASHHFVNTGVLRPAYVDWQADFYRDAAETYPHFAAWLSRGEASERFPAVVVGTGALLVTGGGAVDIPAFVEAMVDAAARNGAQTFTHCRLTGWKEHTDHVAITASWPPDDQPLEVRAGRLILAMGPGYAAFPELRSLKLHQVKGQVIRLERPPTLRNLPHVAGRGYAVMRETSIQAGSTYEHTFDTLSPTPEATRDILRRVVHMLPHLRETPVLEERAGVRVTVPGIRLPMVGPLPGSGRVWFFGALGSKGLLFAPLLARALPSYLDDPSRIPGDVRIRMA